MSEISFCRDLTILEQQAFERAIGIAGLIDELEELIGAEAVNDFLGKIPLRATPANFEERIQHEINLAREKRRSTQLHDEASPAESAD